MGTPGINYDDSSGRSFTSVRQSIAALPPLRQRKQGTRVEPCRIKGEAIWNAHLYFTGKMLKKEHSQTMSWQCYHGKMMIKHQTWTHVSGKLTCLSDRLAIASLVSTSVAAVAMK